MKALTLHQPWADLVVSDAQWVETRSWSTGYTGPLAIHASQNTDGWVLARREPFRSALIAAGVARSPDGPLPTAPAGFAYDLRVGVVLGVVFVTHCVRVEDALVGQLPPNQRAFGDFRPGRFAWFLAGAIPFRDPLPARGQPRLWEWDGAPENWWTLPRRRTVPKAVRDG